MGKLGGLVGFRSFLLLAFVHGQASETCSEAKQVEGASMLSARTVRDRVAGLSSELNESLQDMLEENLLNDANATQGFPDAEEANSSGPEHGLGALSKPFEFLYAKARPWFCAPLIRHVSLVAIFCSARWLNWRRL